MSVIFIAGTDTGAGKTIVAGLLGRYLLDEGKSVVTQKWVETGRKSFEDTDISTHLKLMGENSQTFADNLSLMAPYSFSFAASPHLAAGFENIRIDTEKIKRSVRKLSRRFDFVIVEGTGGLLVPFSDKVLLIDIVRGLRIPLVLVAANRIGAINHTLLSIEALQRRRMKILGIVFDDPADDESGVILSDNQKIVKKFSKATVIGRLRRAEDFDLLYKRFRPLGAKILSRLLGV